MQSMQELALSLNNPRGLGMIVGVCAAILAVSALFFVVCGKRDRLGALLVPTAFVELSVVFIFLTNGLEEMGGMDSSSKLMPYLWSLPLLAVSLFQLIRTWRAPRLKAVGHGRVDKVFWAFAIVAAAISQFGTLGFFVCTAAMLALLMLLLGERRILLILGTAACWVLFTWFVFNKVLLIGLPAGTLFSKLFV
ncbi:MAG: tripartite tricarboxylate transporter TctB family protein [Pyramidobacter porci]|uniref:tripartite tricarboxylate transporter TctB family protein n=1 Tax=Pyramidobacter porci TaxID=2605789 RepID=UPI002A754EC8|nr:tripartite tricarboxylate transporter TctB family protein [Pyramidobacter porci]MDY2648570.1 tripartite tricarboxylate transporter TctB family protein [Pyramidobacter porci]